MEPSTARELTPDDHRTGFLRSLPRKIVEIKATFGAMIADPRSTRMRDELRRRLHALHTLARSYELASLTESVRACIDIVDASRTAPVFSRAHIDRLASHIAAFAACAETDAQGLLAPSSDSSPGAPRSDLPRFQPLRVSSVPSPPALRPQSGRGTIPDGAALAREIQTDSTKPTVVHRTLPPGAVLRKSSPANARIGAAVHVLFVGNSSRASALHDVMSSEVELVVTRTSADAIQRAKESAPDVIVAEVEGPAEGVSLVASLKSDPLTEFFPVVLIAPPGESPETVRERCADAADIAAHGADGQSLWDVLDRVLSGANPLIPVSSTDFGEVTLDELTRALQDELRRGIVGAASPRARGARIALGQGNEVLAATWEAIARIREVVERRSNGSVRFELPTAPRGLPGTQVLVPGHDEPSVDTSVVAGEDPLPGRTVLVVDDDPAVVKNFSGLLRDAGMHVTEQTNGLDALQTARRVRPDLVIADIVMPGLDGFALCRAIRRDVILRHTPVVLISWRDDLLVKMREMGAQAQGYLRKEVGGEAILARVRDALRLRTRILKQVAEVTDAAEVRGRVERVGVVALLEAVAQARRDVRVSVVDAGSETELHVRSGALVSLSRTAQDGSLTRGEAALMPLLGLGSARFVVRASDAPREPEGEAAARENLLDVVARSARKIAALEESLTGKVLLEVVRVELDRDAAAAYARALPKTTRAVVDRIIEGEAPRDLVLRDGIAPADLEPLLMELARRGAVQRVLGARGEDLAALRMIAPEPALASSPGAAREQEARDAALSILTAGESSRPGNSNRTTAQYAPVPVQDAAEAPAAGGAKKGDTLADAVMRELRDTVDDPSRRMRASHSDVGSAASSTDEPPAQTGEHERATREPDLPPLPELTEELSDLKTPASPLPENLIAQSKLPHDPARERPSSGARPDDDPSKTRTLPPEMLNELMDVARDTKGLSDADIPSPRLSAPEPEVELGDALDEVVTEVIVDEDRKVTQRRLAAVAKPPPPPVQARQSGSGRFSKPFVPAASGRTQRSSKPATHPLDALPGDEITTPSELLGRDDLPPRKSAEPAAQARKSTEAPEVTRETREAPDPEDPSERETARAPAQKRVSSSEETAPLSGSARASASQARESSQSRPILLLLGVMGAFGGSYYGVRWLLSQPTPDAAPIVTVQEEDAPEAVAPTPTTADAGAQGATTDAARAAPVVTPPTSAESADAGGVEYRDPGPWLDGSTLPVGSGLLVVSAPRAGASAVEVQIDQRPAGGAPTQAVLSEGLHTVRFRAGIITSYQFATVRGSRAVVIAPPSDR